MVIRKIFILKISLANFDLDESESRIFGDPRKWNCENAWFVTSSKFTRLENLYVYSRFTENQVDYLGFNVSVNRKCPAQNKCCFTTVSPGPSDLSVGRYLWWWLCDIIGTLGWWQPCSSLCKLSYNDAENKYPPTKLEMATKLSDRICEKDLIHTSNCVTLKKHTFSCKWGIRLKLSVQ